MSRMALINRQGSGGKGQHLEAARRRRHKDVWLTDGPLALALINCAPVSAANFGGSTINPDNIWKKKGRICF